MIYKKILLIFIQNNPLTFVSKQRKILFYVWSLVQFKIFMFILSNFRDAESGDIVKVTMNVKMNVFIVVVKTSKTFKDSFLYLNG